MARRERLEGFLALAAEELAAAERLIPVAPRQAAYFLAQAVEKVARAALVAVDVPFGTGHDIGRMAALLPPADPWRDRFLEFAFLSAASTKYRYPTPTGRLLPPPGPEELQALAADVRALVEEGRDLLAD